MSEYIRKSDAEAALLQLRKGYRRVDEKCAVGSCILEIRELPAAKNVTEVVCGEWVWKDLHGDGALTLCCSVCLGTDGARETAHYCSECGAKMNGGTEGGKA